MYRPSPVRNPRSKGIKTKNVLQVCLLVAVCFWLIFQVKRSNDKKKEFDTNDKSTTRNTRSGEEIVKFGRKNLPQKPDQIVTKHEHEHEHGEEEIEEDKIDEEKDDEIDENEQEKSNVEVDQEEVDIIDEESQMDNKVDQDEEHTHTHELREEHYKADDASSAVTHDGRSLGMQNEVKNETFSGIQENDQNVANSREIFGNSTYVLENSSSNLEEKEHRTDLDTLPEIETEGDNNEDTAAE